jgi:phosphatidylglycerol:prolipoprotein diacylglycerol transferase
MHSHFSHTDFVTAFGLLFIAALGTCWWLARRNAASIGIHPSHIDLLLPLAILGGIAGGWLLSLLTPGDRLLAGEELQVEVRLRLFGVVISGAVIAFVYSRLNGQSFRSLLDTLALPTIVALMIHRIGCFYAGCCWGDVSVHDGSLTSIAATDLGQQVQTFPWLAGEWIKTSVQYAPGTMPYEQHLALGLISADAPLSLPVHPVQIYESALLLLLFLFLRRVPLEHSRPGTVAALTAISYAVIRFMTEYVRADGALAMGILTTTQLQCIALMGITLFAAAAVKGPRVTSID